MPKKIYPWEFIAIPKFIVRDERLKNIDKLILGYLITRMNGENMAPSKIKTKAELLGCSESSVRRSVKRLKKLKLIEVKRMGKTLANRYKINI